jgi:branched-chain amino acid transport system permease protein
MAGYAGILSLANVGFVLIGAYLSGILSKFFGVPPAVSILIAATLTSIAVTVVLALPALRMTGIYVALLTIVFADTLPSIISMTSEYTGGIIGLREVPLLWEGMTRPGAYYALFGVFLAISYITWRIIRSRTGLAFQALRDDEELANSLGVNIFKEKLKVFAVCSFLTGLMGGFYVHYLGVVSPATNSLDSFMLALCMIFLGGLGRFPGPIMGAFFLTVANQLLQLAGTWRPFLIGVLICGLIMFLPGGFMQIVDWIDKMRKRSAAALPKTG